VIIWVDPQEHSTALIAACRLGNEAVLEAVLRRAQAAFNLTCAQDFKLFLMCADKDGFSPLHTKCKDGYTVLVDVLLSQVEAVFAEDPEGSKRFLTRANNDGFSALNTACKEGHIAVVDILLRQAQIVFLDDTKRFKRFLNQVNHDGFAPLNSACTALEKKPQRFRIF